MRLKLDENLPHSAALQPAALGFDVDTVLDEHLGGHSDETVWAAAQREQSGAVGESSRDAPLEWIAEDLTPRFILCCAGAICSMYHEISAEIRVELAA